MRARGRLVSAALAAAVVGIVACRGDITNIHVDQWQAQGPVIAIDTNPTGNCPVVTVAGVGVLDVRNDTLYMPGVGSTARVEAHASGSCVTRQLFHYTAEHPEIAAVIDVDSITGLITAYGPGTTHVTAWYVPLNFPTTFSVVVGGTTSCTVSSFSASVGNTSLLVGQTTQITVNQTSSPAGCAGVTYRASGSVSVSSSGLVTANSDGMGIVTVNSTVPGHSTVLTFTVTSPSVSANPSSITLSNCSGFQSSWPITATVNGSSVAINSMTSSNPTVATTNGSTVTLTGTAGTTTITIGTASGSTTIPVNVTQCNTQVVITPNGPFNLQSGVGCTNTSVQLSANVAVMWSSSNASIATVNSSGLVSVVSGASGSATITATPTGGGTPASVTVNVSNASCQSARVDSVTLVPSTWNLIVGGPDVTLTATVWGTPGISQVVTFGNSQPGCATITQNSNQVIVHALMACANVVISATSAADNSKSDTSVGTISSGTISCVVRDSVTNARIDSTLVVMAAGTTRYPVVVTCTNQFGTQFRPWGESNHPEIAAIVGSSNININGVNWPAGPYFTITREGAGTARMTFHAAVTDQTVITWFDISFP